MSFINLDTSLATAIMQASPDAIILTDELDRIKEFNITAEAIFGYRRSDMLGVVLNEFIVDTEHRETYQKAKQACLTHQAGSSQRLELSGLHADGSTFPIEVTMIAAKSVQGTHFVLFIRDITLKKANEDKLRRTSARLGNMVSNVQGGIVLFNEQRRLELVNEKFCAMFNINTPVDELIGTSSTQIVDAITAMVINPEGFMDRVRELIGKREFVLNDIIHLVDGRILSRDFIPVYDEGVYLGSLTHFHDVTKEFETRKRWEKLLNLEELNKEIIRIFLQNDDAEDAIAQTLALVGQLLDVSRAYVFRFRETERLVDNTHEWCAPDAKPEIDHLQGIPFDELLPSLFPMLMENSVIAPYHISTLPADIRNILEPQGIESLLMLPLYSGGRIEGFIGCDENRYPREWLPEEIASFRLIAESYARALEREKTQLDLVEARDTALRTAQIRSQFVANMSHEIRTPMTGVLGMLELLNETQLDDDQREFAQTAFSSAERLLHIINDILDFSKLDAGYVILEAEPVVLADIANEVRSTLAIQRTQRPVEFRVNIAPEIPARVKTDPTRLRQILMNLAGNAMKFTHEGFVEIRLSLLASQAGHARIRFEVADTGIGIEKCQLTSIFDSFIQVDGSITRKYGGTGLGLSITKQLIELMGGTIEVESVVGQGSTFFFDLTLPIVSTGSLSQLSHRTQFEDLKVLIIDDEPTSRYLYTQQLKRYLVKATAINSEEAGRLLQQPLADQTQYDLIFFHDTGAPGLTDAESLRALTVLQSDDRVILLVDQSDTPPLPNQLQRPARHADLYAILLRAIRSEVVTNQVVPVDEQKTVHRQPLGVSENTEVQVTPKRILLAEDYPLNAKLVATALEDENWDLDIVENGLQALEQLEHADYDLILMDIQMPMMNGLEATQWIRTSSTPYRSIPILALTASAMKEERDNYLKVGMNDVIIKPFALTQLRETIRQWLNA